ncbi:MAG: ABC transporter ATP-binding protein [Comamonadaceae bacterium]|nr:MAG: ABC transporter ATP-binding protein [Comamonadaceae bacterium]
MSGGRPFLEVSGITVRFGGLVAVNNLSFEVQRGSIHALIGHNGAGKSTTFNCISRYYQPTEGRITVDGEDVTHHAPTRMAGMGIARTFQNLELFGDLSVYENVLLGCHSHSANTLGRLLRRPSGEIRDLVDSLIERVGLTHDRETRAKELDFGHQKLLEIARALALKPRLLLLDEPAAGLRNRDIENLDRLLTELAEKDGITVLLVEHVMQLVMSISDRITVMSFGQKIAEGTPKEISENTAVIEAYLGKGAAHV